MLWIKVIFTLLLVCRRISSQFGAWNWNQGYFANSQFTSDWNTKNQPNYLPPNINSQVGQWENLPYKEAPTLNYENTYVNQNLPEKTSTDFKNEDHQTFINGKNSKSGENVFENSENGATNSLNAIVNWNYNSDIDDDYNKNLLYSVWNPEDKSNQLLFEKNGETKAKGQKQILVRDRNENSVWDSNTPYSLNSNKDFKLQGWNSKPFKTNKNSKKESFTTTGSSKNKLTITTTKRPYSTTKKLLSEEQKTPKPSDKSKKDSTAFRKDAHVLDELDKNEWYFRPESDFPEIDINSKLNIDVSKLWAFDRLKKTRKTRDADENIVCKCVDVNLCDEENIIMSKEMPQIELWPVSDFGCQKLTEVCCTDPKFKVLNNNPLGKTKRPFSSCGRRFVTKPVEDVTSKQEGFPWLLKLKNSEGDFICGASLFQSQLALTAAHCVFRMKTIELIVASGSEDDDSQIRKVVKTIIHPDYNHESPRNDIALLVLETPFEFTDNVNTICLPGINDKWDSSSCVASDWEPRKQHVGFVKFLSQQQCQNIMLITALWKKYILHDSFICGLEKEGRRICLGNEGGPVICPSSSSVNKFFQVGIISKSINCDELGRPGIFTNVLKFIDWANENAIDLGLLDSLYSEET